MTEEQLLDFYTNNTDILSSQDLFMSFLRNVGFALLQLLVKLASACEKLYDVTFGLVDVTSFPKINNWINEFKPLFIALMAVSIFALGIMLIFNVKRKPKILVNICVAILCVTCSTLCFNQMNSIVKDLKSGIDAISVEENIDNSYSIISNNMVDLYYLDDQIGLSNINFKNDKGKLPRYSLNSNKMGVMNYSEVLPPKDKDYDYKDKQAEEILSHGMRMSTKPGELYKIVELDDGFPVKRFHNQYYYRYQMDAIPIILQLFSVIILYLASAYKCTRIAYELINARLLSYLLSAELSGGEKIGKTLIFIRDSYILLILTTVSIKIYFLLSSVLNSVEAIQNDTLVKSIILVFLAFAVVDGPNLVERLLGMDVGLQSSTGRLITMYKLAQTGSRAGHSAIAHIKYNQAQRASEKIAKEMNAERNNNMKSGIGADNNKTSNFNTDFMNSAGVSASSGINGSEHSQEQMKNGNESTAFASETRNGEKEKGFNTDFMNENKNTDADGMSGISNSEEGMKNNPKDNEHGKPFSTDFMKNDKDKGSSGIKNAEEKMKNGTSNNHNKNFNAGLMNSTPKKTSGIKSAESQMKNQASGINKTNKATPAGMASSNKKNINGIKSRDFKPSNRPLSQTTPNNIHKTNYGRPKSVLAKDNLLERNMRKRGDKK